MRQVHLMQALHQPGHLIIQMPYIFYRRGHLEPRFWFIQEIYSSPLNIKQTFSCFYVNYLSFLPALALYPVVFLVLLVLLGSANRLGRLPAPSRVDL
jgi:hypothetical protein